MGRFSRVGNWVAGASIATRSRRTREVLRVAHDMHVNAAFSCSFSGALLPNWGIDHEHHKPNRPQDADIRALHGSNEERSLGKKCVLNHLLWSVEVICNLVCWSCSDANDCAQLLSLIALSWLPRPGHKVCRRHKGRTTDKWQYCPLHVFKVTWAVTSTVISDVLCDFPSPCSGVTEDSAYSIVNIGSRHSFREHAIGHCEQHSRASTIWKRGCANTAHARTFWQRVLQLATLQWAG